MKPSKVMVNGMPGNMATRVARHILADNRYELIPHSLTGPEIASRQHPIDGVTVELIGPADRQQQMATIKKNHGDFFAVDYTHPSAVNANGEFYCQFNLPFVMGTTGGDRQQLEDTVRASSVAAVIAPNMAKPIVGFQAMMEFAASNFSGLFKGYTLEIEESHQMTKADTSGTAKAMVRYFNQLGVSFSEDDIVKVRDPEIQKTQWHIPEEYLAGHGWHTYRLVSDDQTVRLTFSHNVNGREVYARGTLDALAFLQTRVRQGARGKIYSMIDVLRG